MSASSVAQLDIRRLSALLCAGKLSPVELTQATLDRIERKNPELNAYLTVLADAALEQARQAEREIRAGQYRGPLHGVPVSVKDIFFTRGTRTTCGSKIYADYVPDFDATTVERLRAAGAVLVGKTNLHELAYGITNNNPHYGATRNPWDRARIPGGSSGGSGVAVAASLCAASLGTDTGGSVRIPAAYCGTVGLKPTFGRVSRWGVLPLGWSLDHVGPLARTVWDTAVVLRAIAGPDVRDDQCAVTRALDYLVDLDAGVRGMVVGVPEDFFFSGLDAQVERAVRSAAAKLAELGARLEPVRLPFVQAATDLARLVLLAEASAFHQRDLRARRAEFGPDVRALLEQGEFILAADYVNAQRARRKFMQQMASVLRKVTVLIAPTAPITAPPIGATTVPVNGAAEDVRLASTRLVRALNFLGVPVLSLPCGFDEEGLPISLQIIGKPFDEATVLRVGAAYEAACEWVHRRPPD